MRGVSSRFGDTFVLGLVITFVLVTGVRAGVLVSNMDLKFQVGV